MVFFVEGEVDEAIVRTVRKSILLLNTYGFTCS